MVQGHSIEVRVNAEDAFKDFRPSPGRIVQYLPPGGNYVRMDSHVYPEYVVPPNYDSLLGKLIVWGVDRKAAIDRMKRCIDETVIVGVPTTLPFHKLIMNHPMFVAGTVDTGFIQKYADDLVAPEDDPDQPKKHNFVADAARKRSKR
jgi:acetyl-CoA carboxylase, biotin carboxylase subunit